MKTKADNQNQRGLTPAQDKAIDALLAGQTITAAADAANVARQTLSGWLNQDADFIAAYNFRRQALSAEYDHRLRSLAGKAFDVLERELEGERAFDAAKTILRAIASLPRPDGPIDPEEIETTMEEQQNSRFWRDVNANLSPIGQ